MALAGLRCQRPPQHDESHDETEDAELKLGQDGHDGQRRSRFTMILLQLAKPEKQEDGTNRVGLAPDGAVEPGDRVHQNDQGGKEGASIVAAHILDQSPDDRGQAQVGENGQDLRAAFSHVAAGEKTDNAQQEQVNRRIVDEAGPGVEADGAMLGNVVTPTLERAEVVRKARPRQEDVCDDEAEDQTQGQENDDGGNSCDGTTRDGTDRSCRRAPLWAALTQTRSCQPTRPPGRALRWSGV